MNQPEPQKYIRKPSTRYRQQRKDAGTWRCDAPDCQSCHGLTVDHIIPKRGGGADHESNFQLLCRGHHRAKTARENMTFDAAAQPK